MGVEHSPEPRGRRRQAPGRSDQPVDARVDHLPSPHVHHRLLWHELQLDDPDYWQRGRLRAARRDLAYSVCHPDGGVVAAAQTVICRGEESHRAVISVSAKILECRAWMVCFTIL